MKPVLQQSLDDILFENRNKVYGSYWLRKRYFFRLALSFVISVTFLTICTFGYFLYLNSDGDGAVYSYASPNPYLKSTEGNLLDPAELGSYLNNPEPPNSPETKIQNLKKIDVLHNFTVAEEVSVDTFRQTAEEDESSTSNNMSLGISTDSSVFGGFLLGEGEGQGMGSDLDKFPEFPGGTEAVRKYIELTVNYPFQAQKQKLCCQS